MADEQDPLVASRIEDAVDARQQLADSHGIHARQDDTDELALLRLEPLGKEVRLEPRLLDGLTHSLLLLQADVAVIEIARYGAFRDAGQFRDILDRYLCSHNIPSKTGDSSPEKSNVRQLPVNRLLPCALQEVIDPGKRATAKEAA